MAEVQKSIGDIRKRMAKVPDEMKSLSRALAQRGWYLSMAMDFKFLYFLKSYQDADKLKNVDALMIIYLRKHLDEIQGYITAAFPKRAAILAGALAAHVRKEYVLSVPTLLAQADGICSELLGTQLYARSKGTPHTAKAVEPYSSSDLMSSLLEPLRLAGALNAYDHERSKFPDVLNRHEVLHGKSLDYGSEINSLRAISLLSYLSTTVASAIEFSEMDFSQFKTQQNAESNESDSSK
jgi:hypothetical protein